MRCASRDRTGFTLLDLLIVLALVICLVHSRRCWPTTPTPRQTECAAPATCA